ncbi:MAG: hypothetical protein ACREOS_09675, partial [Candidatus Dormibacteraceae bacterium]
VLYFLAYGFGHWWFTAGIIAWLTLVSVLLMACQFGVPAVVLTVAAAVIISVPLLWVARRYVPGAAGTIPI